MDILVFPPLAIVNYAAVNIGAHVSVWVPVLIFWVDFRVEYTLW